MIVKHYTIMARTKQTRRKSGKKRVKGDKECLTRAIDFTEAIYGSKYAPVDSQSISGKKKKSHAIETSVKRLRKATKRANRKEATNRRSLEDLRCKEEIPEALDLPQADMDGVILVSSSSEEEGENCEILWDNALKPRPKRAAVSNVSATVERCCLGAIYLSLNTKGACYVSTKDFKEGDRMAVLYPGKCYVNARRLLIDVVKSNQQLRMIIPIGSEVFVDAHQVDSSVSLLGLKDTGCGRAGEVLRASWEVDMLWPTFGERPRDAAFRHGWHGFNHSAATFENREDSFRDAVAWTLEHALSSGEVKVPR